MDQRVRFRAAHRCAARPAHPSRPYPAIEWRQLQAQSEQAPITPFQFRYAGGSSQPSLILVETAPRWGPLLPASLMYFCFGRPMPHCSGVDTPDVHAGKDGAGVIAARMRNGLASALARAQNHAWIEALAPSSGSIG